jgi:hypothetical protein
MPERQMFGAIVRGVGVYLGTDVVRQMWFIFTRLFLLFPEADFRHPLIQDFLYASILFAMSYLFIRKPEWVIRLAYQREIESDRVPNEA